MFDFLRYEYAAARLRSMKGRLIDKTKFLKMINAKSISEIASVLENTDYESVFYHDKEKTMVGIEIDLDKFFVALLEKIKGFYPDDGKKMVDIFLKEQEAKNLKVISKSVILGEGWSNFIVHTKDENTEAILKSNDMQSLINNLEGNDYQEAVSMASKKTEQFGLPIIDFYIDQRHNDISLKYVEKSKGKEILTSYIKTRNDMLNARNALRSIISGQDMSEFYLEPSNMHLSWFKIRSREALIEKLRSKKIITRTAQGPDDDLLFELDLAKRLEEMVYKFLMESPFDEGLLLYFIIMKRNEIDKIKMITRFVRENLDKKDLKVLLGVEK